MSGRGGEIPNSCQLSFLFPLCGVEEYSEVESKPRHLRNVSVASLKVAGVEIYVGCCCRAFISPISSLLMILLVLVTFSPLILSPTCQNLTNSDYLYIYYLISNPV